MWSHSCIRLAHELHGAIVRLLRRLGLLRADLLIRTVSRMLINSELQAGELVLIENGSLRK
jgi:hypothetical protein